MQKTFLSLFTFSLFSLSAMAQAQKAPEYYSAKFEVESMSAICSPALIGGVTCAALGNIVTAKATLNCGDVLVFSEFTEVQEDDMVKLYAASVVKRHPEADLLRCYAPTIVRKQINVNAPGNIEIFNLNIEANQ